jgi:N-acetylglutamate synthase-like GNAT family acetyltransferase
MKILIRRATEKDAVSICNVLRHSITECCVEDHRNEAPILNAWLENKTPGNVIAWVTSPNNFSVVAVRNGEVQGFGMMSLNGEIRMCYVTPIAQNTGTGKALLMAMENEAKRLAIDELRLNSTVTALAFYLRNGFERKGDPQLFFGIKSYPCMKRISPDAAMDHQPSFSSSLP